MKTFFGLVVFMAMIIITPAIADQHTATAQCALKYQSCQQQCDAGLSGDSAAKAACLAKCSANYAACDAAVAYEKAKPWLDQQTEKAKKFWDELMKTNPDNTTPDSTKDAKDKSI